MCVAQKRVIVGLSGGVDSAVSAYLLKKQGYEVIGLFMKNWEDDDDSEYCSSRQDWLDAASVADVLGIDIEFVNFASEYKDRVFAEFLREYQAGRTPNPDVLCNAEIKFKAFLDHAMRLGGSKIATGHYVRVRERAGRFELLKGLDPAKDQSYFLHRLNQEQLSRTLFPVGELEKTEVRRIAAEIGLPNAGKKDSTGICFIGERPFREFLNRYLAHRPGPICDDRGRLLGEHVGLSFIRWASVKVLVLVVSRKRVLRVAVASMRPGLLPAKTCRPIRCMWCRGMITHGCCRHNWSVTRHRGWRAFRPNPGRMRPRRVTVRQMRHVCMSQYRRRIIQQSIVLR